MTSENRAACTARDTDFAGGRVFEDERERSGKREAAWVGGCGCAQRSVPRIERTPRMAPVWVAVEVKRPKGKGSVIAAEG